MVRVAIPIFKSRVSPAFDSCTRVLLIDLEKKREIERRELYLEGLSLSERVTLFQKLHITTVICGGISDVLHNMLEGAGIYTITGIAGVVEKVMVAFLSNRLDTPVFHMPGYTAKQGVVSREAEEKEVIGEK